MKRLSFLFVATALVAFISLNACKQSEKPADEAEVPAEEVVEEPAEAVMADTAVVEAPAEEAAE